MMRFLVRLVFALAALLAVLVFVIPAFLSGNFHVERAIEIEAPHELVWEQVADFENWEKWNPWILSDPDGRFAIESVDGVEGRRWTWNGELIGRGSLTRIQVDPRTKLVSRLEFVEPSMPPSTTEWSFQAVDGGVEVTWSSHGSMPYPTMRYMALLMDNMLGSQFEEGLERLKRRTEELAAEQAREG